LGSIVQDDEVTGSVLERYFLIDPTAGSVARAGVGPRRQRREMGYVKPGSIADGGGYVIVSVPVGHRQYRKMRAHHLVWMWAHGAMPDGEIDHINGNRADNRISNLRLATISQNRTNKGRQSNNKSGFKWVYKCSQKPGKWRSEITYRDGSGSLRKARFIRNSPEEAHQAALDVAKRYHGDWCNSGEE
jgi:hypothetical protein